jgi:hypothetical protein
MLGEMSLADFVSRLALLTEREFKWCFPFKGNDATEIEHLGFVKYAK